MIITSIFKIKLFTAWIIRLVTIIFIYLFVVNNVIASEIILQKNGIIITNEDLNKYQKLHNDFYGDEINSSSAVKQLYMIFKIINRQIEINPEFIIRTNDIIKEDIIKFEMNYSNYILTYFLRYEILKKDFIGVYIKNNNQSELDRLVTSKIELFSDSECKIKKNSKKFNVLNKYQKQIILNNLLSTSILIEENMYVCLSDINRDQINKTVNNIISLKGYEKFLNYVYRNIK